MKKMYVSPIFQSMSFVADDVITTSSQIVKREWGNDLEDWSLTPTSDVGEF